MSALPLSLHGRGRSLFGRPISVLSNDMSDRLQPAPRFRAPIRLEKCRMKACRLFMLALPVAAAMFAPGTFAWADYPERPVRIVVGFGAGSAADLASRIVGEEL